VLGVLRRALGAQRRPLQLQRGLSRHGIGRRAIVGDLHLEHRKLGDLLADLVHPPLDALPQLFGHLKVAALDLDAH
jgi:hypothetical protein